MLKCRDLSCGYDKKAVLRDINIQFPPGSVTALLGVNGSGKSTLLKTLCRLLDPVKGEITLDGVSIRDYAPRALARKTAFLPQFREAPALDAESLIRHGRFPWLGFTRRFGVRDREIVESAMLKAGVLSLRDRPVRTLSGGERQRCYLAMALAREAEILLLDEPTAALDIAYQFEIMKLISDLREEGKTVVMAIHELSLALSFCDYFILLDAGKVRFSGCLDEILKQDILRDVFHIRLISSGGYWLCVPDNAGQ